MSTNKRPPLPPVAELHRVFQYRPTDGALLWRIKPRRDKNIGDLAGSNNTKRPNHIVLAGRTFPRAHAVWAMHKGAWPIGCVSRKNKNSKDDRIENLHIETRHEVARRTRCPNAAAPGAHRSGATWKATISFGGRVRYLGQFATAEEASAAFKKAHAEIHRDRSPYFQRGDDK